MKDEMVKKLHIRDEMLKETKEKGCGGHDCKKFMTASDTGPERSWCASLNSI